MLQRCCVVLVTPQFGGNVGATARAIKNTGLGPLRLVAPRYENHKEVMIFGHNAEDVLAGMTVYDDLPAASRGCHRVVGFTGRQRFRRELTPLRSFAQDWVGEMLRLQAEGASAPEAPDTALVFGNERDGLTNLELDHCNDLVWIPSSPQHPSYNLAQAVLLAGYELFVARMAVDPSMPRVEPRQTRRPPPSQLATSDEIEDVYRHLQTAFLAIDHGRPHTIKPLMRAYREVFARARLYRREAKLLRGLARKILVAAGRDAPRPVRPRAKAAAKARPKTGA